MLQKQLCLKFETVRKQVEVEIAGVSHISFTSDLLVCCHEVLDVSDL